MHTAACGNVRALTVSFLFKGGFPCSSVNMSEKTEIFFSKILHRVDRNRFHYANGASPARFNDKICYCEILSIFLRNLLNLIEGGTGFE